MTVNPEKPVLNSIYKIVVGDKVYYKGNPDPSSFLEYDFSFIVNKYTENQFMVDEIDNYTKEQGWKSIFPTSIETEENDTNLYFGYLGNTYFLEIEPVEDPGEEVLVYETENSEPVTITFDENEIKFHKFLYFYVSSNQVASINLSYDAWKIDKNPYRNRDKYVLRNDTYRTYIINPVTETGYDKRSGTLLGNIEETNTPILRKKLSRLNYEAYSPKRVYKSGEEAKYNDKTYISVSNYNIGNYPPISKEWMLKSE